MSAGTLVKDACDLQMAHGTNGREALLAMRDRAEPISVHAVSSEPPKPQGWAPALSAAVCDAPSLCHLDLPARQPILGDWFMQGDLGFVFAPRGLGKTWLSLAMSAAISEGGQCGPWTNTRARRVLYIDGEMAAESLSQRIAGMTSGAATNLFVLNHEALFHSTGKTLNLADKILQDALTQHLIDTGVEVLFLDNLSCLFSGVAENESDAWEAVLQWLLTLRRHRIAVVVVHHAGRNGAMRGTSRREDAAFWIIRLDEIGDGEQREGARFRSRFTKDRNSRNEQSALEWHFSTDAGGTVAVSTKLASSSDVFRQWIADGLTGAEDIAREMGVSKGTVSKWAKRGMEQGWLTKHGREYVLV